LATVISNRGTAVVAQAEDGRLWRPPAGQAPALPAPTWSC